MEFSYEIRVFHQQKILTPPNQLFDLERITPKIEVSIFVKCPLFSTIIIILIISRFPRHVSVCVCDAQFSLTISCDRMIMEVVTTAVLQLFNEKWWKKKFSFSLSNFSWENITKWLFSIVIDAYWYYLVSFHSEVCLQWSKRFFNYLNENCIKKQWLQNISTHFFSTFYGNF